MLDNVAVRVLVAAMVVVLGFALMKYVSADKKQTVYTKQLYAKAYKKPAQKNRGYGEPVQARSVRKSVTWAPSVVDNTMTTQGGDWANNRNPATAVSNVTRDFPESSTMQIVDTPFPPKGAADGNMTGEWGSMPLPAVGSENPFEVEFGSTF